MKKICFIINSSGSLSVAFPLIEILKKKKIGLILFYSRELLNNKILKNIKIEKKYLKETISIKSCLKYLKIIQPSLVFCGNNGNNIFEANFARSVKINKNRSLAIMDSWSYPSRRFQFKSGDKKKFLFPDIIGVPNIKILREIKKLNKDKSKFFIAGYPQLNFNAYNFFLKQKKTYTKDTLDLLYISTPYEKPKKKNITDGTEIFFDQNKIILLFLNTLYHFLKKNKIKINLTFRLHPLEKVKSKNFFNQIFKSFKKINFIFDKNIHNYDSYLNKDAVFGISSMMLYEAAICKLPSFSLQFNGEFNKRGKINYFKNISQIKVCSNLLYLENEIKKIYKNKQKNKIKVPDFKSSFFKKNIKLVEKIIKLNK